MTEQLSRPPGEWDIDRFYLGDEEVTQAEWVRAERSAGFWPKGEDRGQPATAGFSGFGYQGRTTTIYTSSALPAPWENAPLRCKNCGKMIVEVYEATWQHRESVAVFRHWNELYPQSIGPRECGLPPIYLMAVPEGA